MADVEVKNKPEAEKVEDVDESSKEVSENGDAEAKPKENGEKAENGNGNIDKDDSESNGIEEITEVPVATKRKSTAEDATDGKEVQASPEKKAKISQEESEEKETNGEAQAVA